jgi:hypothetical protein
VVGYHRENASLVLKVFLSRVNDLIARHESLAMPAATIA